MYAIEMTDSVSVPRTVEWQGDLTVARVAEARDEIVAALRHDEPVIWLDLREVPRVDMAGLQLVWSAVQTVGAQGRKLVVLAGAAVIESAERAGLDPFWTEDTHVG